MSARSTQLTFTEQWWDRFNAQNISQLRTTQLLGGNSTFVLSSSGHIASLVNPPGNPKSSYMLGGAAGPDPEVWVAGATKHTGSWWEFWSGWVSERSGELKSAPADPGSPDYPPLAHAPGTYVHG